MKKHNVHTTSKQPGRRNKGVAIAQHRALIWARELSKDKFDVPARDFSVLCAIISRIDGEYYCYPTQQQIAVDAKWLPQRLAKVDIKGTSPENSKAIKSATKRVGKATKVLEAANLIRVKRTPTRYSGTRSEYWVLPDSDAGSENREPPSNQAGEPTTGSLGPDSGVGSSYKEKHIRITEKTADRPQAQHHQHHQHRTITSYLRETISAAELAEIWKELISEHHNGASFFPGNKEIGQLGDLINHLDRYSLPVVKYAIKNWSDLTDDAKNKAGAFNCPGNPDVGFLLKYRGIAFDLYREYGEFSKDRIKIDEAKTKEETSQAILELAKERQFHLPIVEYDMDYAVEIFFACSLVQENLAYSSSDPSCEQLLRSWEAHTFLAITDKDLYQEIMSRPEDDWRMIIRMLVSMGLEETGDGEDYHHPIKFARMVLSWYIKDDLAKIFGVPIDPPPTDETEVIVFKRLIS